MARATAGTSAGPVHVAHVALQLGHRHSFPIAATLGEPALAAGENLVADRDKADTR